MTGAYVYAPDIGPPLAAAIFVTALGLYIWRRRSAPAVKPFIAISLLRRRAGLLSIDAHPYSDGMLGLSGRQARAPTMTDLVQVTPADGADCSPVRPLEQQ